MLPASSAALTSPNTTAAAPAPGETVTAAAAAVTAKPKRGRGAAGTSVFPAPDLASASADAKTRGGRFTPFTVEIPGKPVRFFTSNHRNAVMFAIMTADGYKIVSGDGTSKGGRKPADPVKRADELLNAMSEETRRELFAKYIGTNPALAASLPAAAEKRVDTSPEFDKAPNSPAAGTADRKTVPAPAGTSVAQSNTVKGKPGGKK